MIIYTFNKKNCEIVEYNKGGGHCYQQASFWGEGITNILFERGGGSGFSQENGTGDSEMFKGILVIDVDYNIYTK